MAPAMREDMHRYLVKCYVPRKKSNASVSSAHLLLKAQKQLPGSHKSSSGPCLWNQLAYYLGNKNVMGVFQHFPALEESESTNSTFTEWGELQPLPDPSARAGNRELGKVLQGVSPLQGGTQSRCGTCSHTCIFNGSTRHGWNTSLHSCYRGKSFETLTRASALKEKVVTPQVINKHFAALQESEETVTWQSSWLTLLATAY